MKESNLYSDDFEALIRQKTEQYKMYPSDRVWKGVHSSLHTKRKWFYGGMAAMVMGILFFAGKELINPSSRSNIAKKTMPSAPLTMESQENKSQGSISGTRPILASNITQRHIGQAGDPDGGAGLHKEVTITISNPVISQPDLSEFFNRPVRLPEQVPSLTLAASMPPAPIRLNPDGPIVLKEGATFTDAEEAAEEAREARLASNLRGHGTPSYETLASTRPQRRPILDGAVSTQASESAKTSASAVAEAGDHQRINWLQDYAANQFNMPSRRDRKYLELYFAPTINYRTLDGGNFSTPKMTVQTVPIAVMHPGDAKNYVDHSPALGFEVGSSFLYRLTRNLSIKAGLQFSFSRYTIKAYSSSPQQATVAYNSYYGYIVDSITSITNIRNFGGKTAETLNNDYYQIAAPVGFELRVLGNERLELNVGATVQPTYLLNTNSYLLTTDYTNYTKEPSLLRRWNMSAGLEAFLSYKAKGMRWQIGPEFRYQLFSTYVSQYPIHENLKGYGLRIGVIRPLP
jgi:hypothetical protein